MSQVHPLARTAPRMRAEIKASAAKPTSSAMSACKDGGSATFALSHRKLKRASNAQKARYESVCPTGVCSKSADRVGCEVDEASNSHTAVCGRLSLHCGGTTPFSRAAWIGCHGPYLCCSAEKPGV